MSTLQKHDHNFDKLELIPVIADNPKYPSDGKRMGILARVCTCGKQEAFEYGERSVMRRLLEELQATNAV